MKTTYMQVNIHKFAVIAVILTCTQTLIRTLVTATHSLGKHTSRIRGLFPVFELVGNVKAGNLGLPIDHPVT